MTELHLLRHADAGDPLVWEGRDDDRPLSDKGERQAERLGAFLARVRFRPDVMAASPKVRALRTAEIVARHLDLEVKVDDRLAGELGLETLERLLRDIGDPGRPVIVGHDPDFSDLLALLSGTSHVPMRKGALARVDVERPLEAGRGTLRWLIPPALLKPER